jgi:hypothetical protein
MLPLVTRIRGWIPVNSLYIVSYRKE